MVLADLDKAIVLTIFTSKANLLRRCSHSARFAILIRDALLAQSVDVTLPLFDGTAEEIRRDHYETLAQCDGALLYWGRSGEGWLRTKLREMTKAFGLGRTSPYKATAIYLAGLPDPKQEAFRALEATIIRGDSASPAGALRPFVASLSGQ